MHLKSHARRHTFWDGGAEGPFTHLCRKLHLDNIARISIMWADDVDDAAGVAVIVVVVIIIVVVSSVERSERHHSEVYQVALIKAT